MAQMSSTPEQIAGWSDVDRATFHDEIVPKNQPAILRGVVRGWPAVRQGSASPQAMCAYLMGLQQGKLVPLVTADPATQGRFFFREDMRGFNFQRRQAAMAVALRMLLTHLHDTEPPGIFVEAAPLPDCLPDFAGGNRLDLLDDSIVPRIWIGNAVTVQTHYDLSSNVACVLSGHRRFTLFPPEQLPNLYPGPMHITPAGVPISMVPLQNPDFGRYPRFREALAAARVAELGPGDALFIPCGWWHHVQSLGTFNVLVNYWWANSNPATSPLHSLLHGLLALRDMPAAERAIWRNLFDYYVFQSNGDPVAHLPPAMHGPLGAHSPELVREIKALLADELSRP
jgi:Cupin-like domain